MAAATLTLGAKERPQQPIPAFDPRGHFAEIGGIHGVKYVQGDNFFDSIRRFVRPADEAHRLAPLTREQELDRLMRMREQAARSTVIGDKRGGQVPQHIIDAERENARAAGAETLSG